MKTPLIALAAAASALTALPVAAERNSISIAYRDLNLATPEGQAALDHRISKAARAMCGVDELSTGTRLRSGEAIACYREAKAQAKKQVAAAIAAQQLGG
jgi:UrcA family protein